MIVDQGNMTGSDVLGVHVPVHGVRIDVVELVPDGAASATAAT